MLLIDLYATARRPWLWGPLNFEIVWRLAPGGVTYNGGLSFPTLSLEPKHAPTRSLPRHSHPRP